jgi:hypothetical protein
MTAETVERSANLYGAVGVNKLVRKRESSRDVTTKPLHYGDMLHLVTKKHDFFSKLQSRKMS